MESLRRQALAVAHRWRVVVLAVGLATAIAAAVSLAQGPAWSATATLLVGPRTSTSNPDTQAALARGYADLLNSESYQQFLHTRDVPADVEVVARPVAASPLISVTATASRPQRAQESANLAAARFVKNLESTRAALVTAAARPLTAALGAIRSAIVITDPLGNQDLRARLEREADLLQNEIDSIPTTGTSAVAVLAPAAGAQHVAPQLLRVAGMAAIGGLVLGVGLALFLSSGRGELSTPRRVEDELGLPVLAHVSVGPRGELSLNRKELEDLAGSLRRHGTVAVTSCDPDSGKSAIARLLAQACASPNGRVALVEADPWVLHRDSATDAEESGSGVEVVPPGAERAIGAHLVVIDAPPLAAGTRALPSSLHDVDAALLVVDSVRTRAADAVVARDVVAISRATLLGVVLCESRGHAVAARR